MTGRESQVKVVGYVKTDIINSRSEFSFLIGADEWSEMSDEERDETTLEAMLESLDWNYQTETQDEWVHIRGTIKTNIINSATSFEESFPVDDWNSMTDGERDQAVLSGILTSGAIEWDYTPPDIQRASPSP